MTLTVPKVLDVIDQRAKAWRAEEIDAIAKRDDARANNCRQKAAVLEDVARAVREAA